MRVARRRWTAGGVLLAILVAAMLRAPAQAGASNPDTWSTTDCPPRLGAAAVFDSRRNRMLVLGGFDGIQRSDVWSLSLDGISAWTRLVANGTPPAGRSGHTAFYDVRRDRILVFGGSGDAGLLGDLWELALNGIPTWTQLTPPGFVPTSRADHAVAYDPQRDFMLVFGGWDHPTHFLEETWTLSLDGAPRWERLATNAGPTARKDAAVVFDAALDRMLVFGGIDTAYRNDVWALALKPVPTWSQVTVTGTPPSGRRDAAMILDAVRGSALLFGGLDGTYRDDTWELRLESAPKWERIAVGSPAPARRSYHAAVLDETARRVLVFGGYNGSILQDTWSFALAEGATWTRVAPTLAAPSPRLGHAGIYDPVSQRFVVFGGYDGTWRNETWALPLDDVHEWTPIVAAGPLPAARIRHSVIHDPVRHRLVVHGGQNAAQLSLNDTWALPLAGPPVWTQLAAAGPAPTVRANHSAIYDPIGDRMLVFGGTSATGGLRADTWSLSFGLAPAWEALAATAPEARSGHVATYDPVRQRMLVFGGLDPIGAPRQDLWEMALDGPPAWQEVEWLGVPPPGRAYHTAAYDPNGTRLYVFGGYDGTSPYRNDLWELSLVSKPTWRVVGQSGAAPAPRGYTCAIFDPVRNALRIFGGGGTRLGDTWTYAPDAASKKAVESEHTSSLIDNSLPRLDAPWPHPCNRTTQFRFALGATSHVVLEIFDVRGRRVRRVLQAQLESGAHVVPWDATDDRGAQLASGAYTCRLQAGNVVRSRRVIVVQ